MARTVAIGIQDFEQIISESYFYVDKTAFIKEWWERKDSFLKTCLFGRKKNIKSCRGHIQ